MERHVETIRNTIAEGELIKLNLVMCDCGKVYVSDQQASKVRDAHSGWYENLAEARGMFEVGSDVDPVIRISPGNRGKKTCPDCKQK